MPLKTPSYRKHASGQATVRILVNGRKRDFYLGKYNSPRSKERYQQVLAEYAASNERSNVVLALRPLRELHGDVDTCDFGPRNQ